MNNKTPSDDTCKDCLCFFHAGSGSIGECDNFVGHRSGQVVFYDTPACKDICKEFHRDTCEPPCSGCPVLDYEIKDVAK